MLPSPLAGDRVLIIKFWGLGNIIQASPTLKMLRQNLPNCHLTFLTLSQNLGLYDRNNLYDRSLALTLKPMLPFVWEVLKLIRLLRKERFKWVIDLEPLTNFSESIAYLSGAPNRVGFVRERFLPPYDSRGEKKGGHSERSEESHKLHSLYTHPVEFHEKIHIRDTFKTIAQSLLPPYNSNGEQKVGLDVLPPYDSWGEKKGGSLERSEEPFDDELIPILLNHEDQSFLDSFSQKHGIRAQDFLVGININASEVAKERRWLPERFAELADRIANTGTARIVFLGSPAERVYVEEAVSRMTTVPIIAAGKTTLRQMIALLGCCNLFISNDSGPVHMASAQGTPTVAIFGPESPDRYGPRESKHRVIYKGLPCSPCISFHNAKKVHCPEPKPPCIYHITVEEVWEAVKPLLPLPTPLRQ